MGLFESPVAGINLGKAFLDCGAYSVLTGFWKELPITQYIDFVGKQHESFRVIAAPDVIGDAKATAVNLKLFMENLPTQVDRAKIAYTYHLNDLDLTTYEKTLEYCKEQRIGWLAIGGLVAGNRNTVSLMVGIEEALRIKEKVYPELKVHLFGGHNTEFIKNFRPDSVDSATYLQAAKNLGAIYFKDWDMLKVNFPRNKVESNALGKKMLDELDIWEGIDKEEFYREFKKTTQAIQLWLVNAMAVKEFERWVNKQWEFTYFMTVATSMPLTIKKRGSAVLEQYEAAWRNRTLVAFPSFLDNKTNAYLNLDYLTMFKGL